MQEELVLQEFESLLQTLSIDLRYETGEFVGGLCKYNNRKMFIINTELPVQKKIKLIATELVPLDLEKIYIRPVLREIIEQAKLREEQDAFKHELILRSAGKWKKKN